jgi:hypothetical protein
MNMELDMPIVSNAHQTLTFSGFSRLAMVNLGFSEAPNHTFYLWIKPLKWKCSSENHMTFKTPEFSYRLYSLKTWHLTIASSSNGWQCCILYGKNERHHDRFSIQLWLILQSTVLNITHIFLDFYYCLLCYTSNFSCVNISAIFISCHMFITQFLNCQTV